MTEHLYLSVCVCARECVRACLSQCLHVETAISATGTASRKRVSKQPPQPLMLEDNEHIFIISCSLWSEHADYGLDLWSSEATLPLLWPGLCWNWVKMRERTTARRRRTETGEKDEDEKRRVGKMKGRIRRKGKQRGR